MMTVDNKVFLEWTYEPKNFIEGRLEFSFLNGSIYAEAGAVNGEFESIRPYDREFPNKAKEELEKWFLIFQLGATGSGDSYKLSNASMHSMNSKGNKIYHLFMETGELKISCGQVGNNKTDEADSIPADPMLERQKARKLKFHDAAQFLDNQLLIEMLRHYKKAKAEKNSCLFHLYAIFQAAELKDKGFKWIPQNSKKILNQYPNNEPFFESRHAGEHPKGDDKMRHLSKEDTDKVFDAAAELIMAYVDNLKEASLST